MDGRGMTERDQPLWRAIEEAFANDVGRVSLGDGFGTVYGDPDGHTWANQILAFADYFFPEEPPPHRGMRPGGSNLTYQEQRSVWRQEVRAKLLEESQRAHRSE